MLMWTFEAQCKQAHIGCLYTKAPDDRRVSIADLQLLSNQVTGTTDNQKPNRKYTKI